MPADAEDLWPVLADPVLYEFTGGTPPTLPELQQRVARWSSGGPADGGQTWLNWLVRVDGEAAGYVQATVRGRVATIAYVVGTKWQGRGLAGAATRRMIEILAARGVEVIEARIHPRHAASAGVAAANGLVPLSDLDAAGEQLWRRSVAPQVR